MRDLDEVSKTKDIQKAFLKSIECSFCSKPLCDPVSTMCNHQFCRKCISDFVKATTKSKCPRCEAAVIITHLKDDKCLAELTHLVTNLTSALNTEINDLVKRVERVPNDRASNKKSSETRRIDRVRIDYKIDSDVTSIEENGKLPSSRSDSDDDKHENGVSLLTQLDNEHNNNDDCRRKKNVVSMLTQLDTEYNLRSSTATVASRSHVEVNDCTNSEDATGQKDVDEPELESAMVENEPAPSEKERKSINSRAKAMTFDTKVSKWLKNNSKNTNVDDEPEILLDHETISSDDERVNFKSRQLQETSKLLDSSLW